jgi:hypothetical protein
VGGVVGCGFETPAPTEELPKVYFAVEQSLTDESITSTQLLLKLSMITASPVTVGYEVTGGSADGSDFNNAQGEVTFEPFQETASLTLSIVADDIEENEEDIQVTLKEPKNAELGDVFEHRLLISANLLPRVRFVAATSRAGEETGVQNFAVQLDRLSPVDVRVRYTWTGSAEPTDHGLVDGFVTIPAGQLSQSLLATIQNDPTDEDDETLDVDLIAQSGAVVAPNLGERIHTIVDDDPPPTIGFAPVASSTGETGTANLAVTLSLASEKPIKVDYLAAGGGTAGAADYTVTPDTLMFPPGTTSVPVPVVISSDALDENDETARVSLANAVNATLQAATTLHTLTITDDDDPPTIEFQQAASTAAEGTATHAVAVRLSAPSAKQIQFSVTRSGSLDDLTLPVATFTISPGDTMASFNTTVVDDAIDEDDETVTLALGSLVNAGLGPRATHTVTITDNDNPPLVRFDPGTPDRSELERSITSATYIYRVVLSAASTKPVTVQVAVGGTAMNNDFNIVSGDIPVVFQPGQTSREIRVIVNPDGSPEQNETVTLTLGTATNATSAGDNQLRTHTIVNDD